MEPRKKKKKKLERIFQDEKCELRFREIDKSKPVPYHDNICCDHTDLNYGDSWLQ